MQPIAKSKKRKRKKKPAKVTKSMAMTMAKIAQANTGPMIHTDHTTTVYPDNSGAASVIIGATDQGSTEHTRRGEECRLLSMRGYFYAAGHTGAHVTTLRYIIFRSMRDEGGTPPACTDVLETCHFNSQFKQDTKKFFIILYDKRIILDNTSRQAQAFKFYINLKNVKQSYNNTAAANYTRGHLFHLYLSNESTNVPTLSGRIRTYLRSV